MYFDVTKVPGSRIAIGKKTPVTEVFASHLAFLLAFEGLAVQLGRARLHRVVALPADYLAELQAGCLASTILQYYFNPPDTAEALILTRFEIRDM